MTFKLKKQSMSGESKMVVHESADSTTWTLIGEYGTATGATTITDCGDITATLASTSRYVRWAYTKAAGNCDLDDVSITSTTAVTADRFEFMPMPSTTGSTGVSFGITVCATDGTNTQVSYATAIDLTDNGSTATYTASPASTATPVSGCATFTITPTSGGNINLNFGNADTQITMSNPLNTGSITITTPPLPMAGDCRTLWNQAGEPTGWWQVGCTPRVSSFACSGSNARTFDTTGDSTIVNYSGVVAEVAFRLKRASMSDTSYMAVYESADGVAWTALDTFGTATNTFGYTPITDCDTILLALNSASHYVLWTYFKDPTNGGNCDLDDVCLNASSSCVADLTENGAPIAAGTYEASNSITSAGTVATGTTVVFNAGAMITLLPGFHATAGCTFTAQIAGGCTPLQAPAPQARKNTVTKQAADLQSLDANIIPNPTYGDALVRYFVPSEGEVCITLHDMSGRNVETVVSARQQLVGWQEATINANGLAKGLYFLYVKTSTEAITRKVIILK